ncbi:pyrimidine utilization protein D [Pantoea sp. 1.19]|uniref:pyrimidine utilization protein D n=1 Tax=Pantoea sp. 1.19 TaxID=1925589 RepID=UPI000948F2E5|nr:pyrimidine utilization protein D [Pantoea sp. 1.19]
MHLDITGNLTPGAPTLVLISGLGGLSNYWLPQRAALGQHYRLVSYDQRGTGANPAALPENYRLADMAAELAAALRARDIGPCTLVGHALGGLIAMQLALDTPQQVTRLAIVNGWLALSGHTRRCFQVRTDLLRHVGVDAYVRAQPLFLYPANWLEDNASRIEAETALQYAHFQGTENLLRRLTALMHADFRSRASALSQPTLVVTAQDDLLVPARCGEQLADALPDASRLALPWGGHAVNVTNSTAFNHALLHWLNAQRAHAA